MLPGQAEQDRAASGTRDRRPRVRHRLRTPQEARALPRRRRLLLAAGVVATIVSIPLLALALRLTHVFEFLMQGSGRA